MKAKEKSSDSQWLKSVVSSGTLNDKVAALTVQVQVSLKKSLLLHVHVSVILNFLLRTLKFYLYTFSLVYCDGSNIHVFQLLQCSSPCQDF